MLLTIVLQMRTRTGSVDATISTTASHVTVVPLLLGSVEDATWSHSQPDQKIAGNDAMAGEAVEADPESVAPDGDGLSEAEREAWTSKLNHYHRAAGHPSNRNLVHLLRDAGLCQWKIAMAKTFRCAACESLKGGSTSSGNIPPAATHPAYRAWQTVGVDSCEWLPPERKKKLRFILFMDLATNLKVVHIVSEYNFLEVRIKSSGEVIQAFGEGWLCDKPKPEILIPDNAKPFLLEEMQRFCSSVGILFAPPAEKEAWAHGIVESAIKDLKMTASAI